MSVGGVTQETVDTVVGCLTSLRDSNASVLPTELVSELLQQRHRFLSLTPNDLLYYFWPCTETNPLHLQSALDALDPPLSVHPTGIRYVSDSLSLSAHLPLPSSGLHLVFSFHSADPHSPWKYHNVTFASIPSPSYSDPETAIAASTSMQASLGDTLEDPSSFWDGYASSENEAPSITHSPPSLSPDADEKAERDYWARYSTNGTADSTIPSPAPLKAAQRFDQSAIHGTPSHDQIARTLVALTEDEHRSTSPPTTDPFVEATEDALRSIYKMWHLRNPERTKNDFLNLVNHTLS